MDVCESSHERSIYPLHDTRREMNESINPYLLQSQPHTGHPRIQYRAAALELSC